MCSFNINEMVEQKVGRVSFDWGTFETNESGAKEDVISVWLPRRAEIPFGRLDAESQVLVLGKPSCKLERLEEPYYTTNPLPIHQRSLYTRHVVTITYIVFFHFLLRKKFYYKYLYIVDIFSLTTVEDYFKGC